MTHLWLFCNQQPAGPVVPAEHIPRRNMPRLVADFSETGGAIHPSESRDMRHLRMGQKMSKDVKTLPSLRSLRWACIHQL